MRAVRSSACSAMQAEHLAADGAAAQQRDLQGLAHERAPHRQVREHGVQGEHVGQRLPADDLGRGAVLHRDDRRLEQVVVVARHRPAVGPGGGDGEQVARCDVGGQPEVAHQDVAALAVLADDAAQGRRGVGAAVGQHARVAGVVEGGADVVAHPAVHGDVVAHQRGARRAAGAEPDRLDRADLVEGDGAGARDRPAGLHGQPGHGQVQLGALRGDDLLQPGRDVGGADRVVLGQVGDAEPAAEVQLGEHLAGGLPELAEQPDHPVRGGLEAGGVEDLRADVAVQTGELEVRFADDADRRGQGVARGQREAELLVLVGGGDELVGVRLDPDGRTDEHRHRGAAGRHPGLRQRHQPVDLVERVDDDVPDPGVDRQLQFHDRLVVAVQGDPLGREARGQRQAELVAAAGVQVQAVLGDPARDLPAEECLRGVVHVGAVEGGGEVRGPAAEVLLVEDEQRRAVGPGELGDRPAAQVQLAVDPLRRARPDVRVERAEVGRGRARRGGLGDVPVQRPRRVRPHIRSGACTPSTARPLRSTVAVAAHAHSRAVVCGPGTSSPRGSTRQES